MMKEITDVAELRKVQLGILDDVVDFCERNDIKYSLCGGTLIGALRHKGYIPWDDDIDLYMPRKEYEKFLALYNEEQRQKNSYYELLSPEISDNYLYTFGKVVDNRTIMQEDETQDFQIGVFVDIFPIDYTVENERLRRWQFKAKRLLYKIRRCKKSRTCYLRSSLAFYCYKYLPVTLGGIEWLQRKIIFRRKPTYLVCDMHNPGLAPACAFPAECMSDYTTAEFEGKQYKIMAGYDTYLRHTYKFHYMTLPPEDQRIHHQFKAWWKD